MNSNTATLLLNINYKNCHPIVRLPQNYAILDFSQGKKLSTNPDAIYSIGKYNEVRPQMYMGELYEKDKRNIHMGIDIGAPVGTPVYSFWCGKILYSDYNDKNLDYGYTLITEHNFKHQTLYALYGHLSKESTIHMCIGQSFTKGEVIGWIGDKSENGGWPPHVHFQLSKIKPEKADMPGVVSKAQLPEALEIYPDPRIVLGPLYD